jgi:hypothetical protein
MAILLKKSLIAEKNNKLTEVLTHPLLRACIVYNLIYL